jgi:hypothetical protein
MSNLLKSKFLLGALVVAVMVVGAFALTATSASADCTITTTLRVGSRGLEVQCLQTGLGITADGAFGPMTQAAVKAWQASKGLSADGIFGPMSRAAWATSNTGATGPLCPNGKTVASNCMTAPGGSTVTGPLCPNGHPVATNCQPSGGSNPPVVTGGAGSIDEATFISGVNNEEVGEDQENVKVLGLDVDADDGSDLRLTSVRVEFEEQGAGGSDDLDDYASEVTIWLGSSEIGSADVEDFSEDDGVWSKTISLSGDNVIEAGETGKLYVAVTALSNIDSGDLGSANNDWDVAVTNIRYTDGTGASLSDNSTGDIGDIDTDPRAFFFNTFASANDVELKLTEASDNPDDMVVEADDADPTDGVVLLKTKLKAEGSEVELQEVTVTITPAGTGDASEIASQYILTVDGEEFSIDSSECEVAGDCDGTGTSTAVEYVFDDIDITIDSGDTVDVMVSADINEVDGSTVAEGDSLTADIDNDDTVAEDEAGEDLSDSETTGVVNGSEIAFYSEGIVVTPGEMEADTSEPDNSGDQVSEFTLEFDVTAIGMDVYLDKTVVSSTSTSSTPSGSNRVSIQTSAGLDLALTGASLTSTDGNAEEQTNSFLISEGDTATFVITVNAAGTDAQQRAILYGLEWGNGDTATQDSVYDLNMGVDGEYKTDYIFVQT